MFKKIYTLEQHSIMIHFQANQPEDGTNVCLRASEVKPKFDRFLVKKFGGLEKIIEEHGSWVRAEHANEIDVSLNYRMTIICKDDIVHIYETDKRNKSQKNRYKKDGSANPYFKQPPEYKLPDIYYGNMNTQCVKYGIFFPSGLRVQITCFHEDLLKKIDEYLAEFFAVTNFGTMQDKGFGSFMIIDNDKLSVPQSLHDYYEASCCYKIVVPNFNNFPQSNTRLQNELFDTIQQVYSIMKSGQNFVNHPERYVRSYIYTYMHKKHTIGNEKAFMKRKGVAPKRTTHNFPIGVNDHEHIRQEKLQDQDFRYVRALLGIGNHVDWIEQENEQGDRSKALKEQVEICDVTDGKDEKGRNIERIERCASPVFFKIVGNIIYITANNPNERIFGRKFQLENKGYDNSSKKWIKNNKPEPTPISPREGKSVSIQTLSIEEGEKFNISYFLECFMEYYNEGITNGKLRIKHKIYRIEVAK